MAINLTYPHATTISKIQLGETVYYLKDLDLRAIVNAFGNATAQDVAASIADGGSGLVTSDQVYDFVTDQIGSLSSVLNLRSESSHSSIANPAKGDFVVESDGKEWLYDGTAWREVGDETAYVLKTLTIAGIDLQDNITAAELKTALSLKALAYADTASVTVDDYATGITGASYTPAGSVSVALSQTSTAASLTKGDYTPEGSVSVTLDQTSTAASLTKGDYTPEGSVSVTLGQTSTAATLTKGDYTPEGSVSISKDAANGTQISGSNAASAVTITPSTGSFISGIKDAAVAPSFSEGAFTPASLTKTDGTFATEGIVVSIDETDSEMLVLTTAGTGSASNITAFSGGSKAADTFSAGSAATFNSANAWTGYTAAEAAPQVFTGDKFKASFSGTLAEDALVTGVNYDKASVSEASFSGTTAENALVTAVNYDKASIDEASFSGTKAANVLVTAVNYDKAGVDSASFNGTAATITPTLNKGEKKITVSPDAAV